MSYRSQLVDLHFPKLCELLFGDRELGHARPAPPRNTLERFGGHLSLQEYRKGTLTADDITLDSRPLVTYPIVAVKKGSVGITDLRRPTTRGVPRGVPRGVRTVVAESEGMLASYETKTPSPKATGLKRFMRKKTKTGLS